MMSWLLAMVLVLRYVSAGGEVVAANITYDLTAEQCEQMRAAAQSEIVPPGIQRVYANCEEHEPNSHVLFGERET